MRENVMVLSRSESRQSFRRQQDSLNSQKRADDLHGRRATTFNLYQKKCMWNLYLKISEIMRESLVTQVIQDPSTTESIVALSVIIGMAIWR